MCHYILIKDELFICGDLNFHVNFMELLDTFDLVQHITEPTHKFGNTLGLIITKTTSLVQLSVVFTYLRQLT